MSTFSVEAASDRVRIGMDHEGRAGFTAANTTARTIRGVAHVRTIGDSVPSWFSVDGDAQREFPPGATQQFEVVIHVPLDAQAGQHEFRLEVIGVELPDEDVGQSASVMVVVGAAPPPPAKSKGYLVTLIGAVAGWVVGAIIGTLPGTLTLIAIAHQAPSVNPNASLGDAIAQAFAEAIATAILAVLLILLGVAVGVWVGPVLGALVALRVRAAAFVGLTVGLLAAFQLIVSILLIVLLVALGKSISGNGPAVAVLVAVGIVDFVAPALLARAATRLIRVRSL